MPKIGPNGNPSYDGQQGTVTNAVGEQFEVNPSRDLEGEHAEGYVNEPVGEFDESPAPGAGGPITPVTEDDDKQDDTEPAVERRDDASSLDLSDQKQNTPPKKATSAKTK